jgi:hypothetical protein
MIATRVLAALALAGAALAVQPVSAAARPAALAGLTTLVADRSGSVDLDLLQDATIQLQPDGSTRDVTLTGKGRLVYVNLVHASGSDGIFVYRTTQAGRQVGYTGVAGTTYPRGSSCPDGPPPVTTVYGVYEPCTPTQPTPKYVVLHQGHYHLRVLTDGAPLRLTLRLHGVTGERTIRPTKALTSSVTPLARIDATAGRIARAQANVRVAATSDALLDLDVVHAPNAAAFGQTSCVYSPGPVAVTDYATHCPQGTRFGFQDGVVVNPYRSWAMTFGESGTLDRGSYRVGTSVEDDQGVTFRGGWLALLERED